MTTIIDKKVQKEWFDGLTMEQISTAFDVFSETCVEMYLFGTKFDDERCLDMSMKCYKIFESHKKDIVRHIKANNDRLKGDWITLLRHILSKKNEMEQKMYRIMNNIVE